MKQDRVYQSASLIPIMDYISKGISFNIGRHLRFGRQHWARAKERFRFHREHNSCVMLRPVGSDHWWVIITGPSRPFWCSTFIRMQLEA
jgi:hypothetical protein